MQQHSTAAAAASTFMPTVSSTVDAKSWIKKSADNAHPRLLQIRPRMPCSIARRMCSAAHTPCTHGSRRPHLLARLQARNQHIGHTEPPLLCWLINEKAQRVAVGGQHQAEGGIRVVGVDDRGSQASALHRHRVGQDGEGLAGVAAQAGAEGRVLAVLQVQGGPRKARQLSQAGLDQRCQGPLSALLRRCEHTDRMHGQPSGLALNSSALKAVLGTARVAASSTSSGAAALRERPSIAGPRGSSGELVIGKSPPCPRCWRLLAGCPDHRMAAAAGVRPITTDRALRLPGPSSMCMLCSLSVRTPGWHHCSLAHALAMQNLIWCIGRVR